MTKCRFEVDINTSQEVLVRLNGKSCLLWILPMGLSLNGTSFPQPDVDYDKKFHIKIIGIDDV